MVGDLSDNLCAVSATCGGGFSEIAPQMRHTKKRRINHMRKHRIERNLAFPSEEFRAKVRTAAKQRGFRTEQAFLIAACEHELERGDNTEAMDDLEARIVATLSNVAREVQALFTLVHTGCPYQLSPAVPPDLRS